MRVSDEELENLVSIFVNLAKWEAQQTGSALKELQAYRKILPQMREDLLLIKDDCVDFVERCDKCLALLDDVMKERE